MHALRFTLRNIKQCTFMFTQSPKDGDRMTPGEMKSLIVGTALITFGMALLAIIFEWNK